MPITTVGVLPPEVQVSFDQMILSTPVPEYIHSMCAMRSVHPAQGGDIHRFRRYNELDAALVPLSEDGTEIQAELLTAIDIDAQLSSYGAYIIINELVTLEAQDNVLNNAAIRLGDQLRKTEDELTRNMLAGTSAFINASNGTNGDIPTNITTGDIDKVTTTLINNNGKMFTAGIDGDLKFDTTPVSAAFIAMCNSALIPNLQNPNYCPEFTTKWKYSFPGQALQAEWGVNNNCRFLVSSIGSVIPKSSFNQQDVYNVFVVAKQAYGIVEQDQYSAQFIFKPAQFSDALNQNVTAGWKFRSAYRILNDAWCLALRVTLAA